MTSTTTADAVDRFLRAVESGDVQSCTAWAQDVVLDATVPNWRFRLKGVDAVRTEYRRWFHDPGTFESLRRMSIPGGEVVEYGLSWTEDGVPHAVHHVHILDIVDGAIVADTVMCGGRWPAALLAEMGAGGDA
jgi:hypothetical protein